MARRSTSSIWDTCWQADQHTLCPDSYITWHEWAERKSKTHKQIQCPGCGRWAIWVRK